MLEFEGNRLILCRRVRMRASKRTFAIQRNTRQETDGIFFLLKDEKVD